MDAVYGQGLQDRSERAALLFERYQQVTAPLAAAAASSQEVAGPAGKPDRRTATDMQSTACWDAAPSFQSKKKKKASCVSAYTANSRPCAIRAGAFPDTRIVRPWYDRPRSLLNVSRPSPAGCHPGWRATAHGAVLAISPRRSEFQLGTCRSGESYTVKQRMLGSSTISRSGTPDACSTRTLPIHAAEETVGQQNPPRSIVAQFPTCASSAPEARQSDDKVGQSYTSSPSSRFTGCSTERTSMVVRRRRMRAK